MRKSFLLPLLAVAGGVGGFFLRKWELASAFEPDTGLPIPMAPAMLALVVLSVLMTAAFLLLCRGKHNPFPRGYDQAFAAKGSTLYLTAMVLAALLALAASVLALLDLSGAYRAAAETQGINPLLSTLPKALLGVLALGAAVGVLLLGVNGYRGAGKGRFSASLLLPAYMACLWLISSYQARAGDPIRQDYLYEILAIIAVLLSAYFISTFSFEKGKVFRTAVFSLLSVYLSLTTLADAHSLSALLLYGFAILYLAAQAAALLSNDAGQPEPTQQVMEETDHEG